MHSHIIILFWLDNISPSLFLIYGTWFSAVCNNRQHQTPLTTIKQSNSNTTYNNSIKLRKNVTAHHPHRKNNPRHIPQTANLLPIRTRSSITHLCILHATPIWGYQQYAIMCAFPPYFGQTRRREGNHIGKDFEGLSAVSPCVDGGWIEAACKESDSFGGGGEEVYGWWVNWEGLDCFLYFWYGSFGFG